jgi:predicted amidohydrolase
MPNLNIALLQLVARGKDRAANLAKGEDACRRAKVIGADIALFPEMWSNGYLYRDDDIDSPDVWREPSLWTDADRARVVTLRENFRGELTRDAIASDDVFVRHFAALAKELEMAIGITFLEIHNGAFRNTLSLFDRRGEIALKYSKVHLCDFDCVEGLLEYGDDFYVCDLDTEQGNVKIGAMICFDREFPESARVLMLKGAEIVLVPNACEMEMNRLTQLRARAFENMMGIALTNYAAPQDNGHSVAYDGIAFDRNGTRDMTIIEADEREQIVLAEFNLDALRDFRTHETWGNAFRRIDRYALITASHVRPPFVRVKANGHPRHP